MSYIEFCFQYFCLPLEGSTQRGRVDIVRFRSRGFKSIHTLFGMGFIPPFFRRGVTPEADVLNLSVARDIRVWTELKFFLPYLVWEGVPSLDDGVEYIFS